MATDEYENFKSAFPKGGKLPVVTSISVGSDIYEMSYTHAKVEALLNHLLSKQIHHPASMSSSIASSTFIDEANKLGFNVLSEGVDIHGEGN